jgi:hypothetical protein
MSIGRKVICTSPSKVNALSTRLGTRIAALLEPGERVLKHVLQMPHGSMLEHSSSFPRTPWLQELMTVSELGERERRIANLTQLVPIPTWSAQETERDSLKRRPPTACRSGVGTPVRSDRRPRLRCDSTRWSSGWTSLRTRSPWRGEARPPSTAGSRLPSQAAGVPDFAFVRGTRAQASSISLPLWGAAPTTQPSSTRRSRMCAASASSGACGGSA